MHLPLHKHNYTRRLARGQPLVTRIYRTETIFDDQSGLELVTSANQLCENLDDLTNKYRVSPTTCQSLCSNTRFFFDFVPPCHHFCQFHEISEMDV
jgi:hypothetical protein